MTTHRGRRRSVRRAARAAFLPLLAFAFAVPVFSQVPDLAALEESAAEARSRGDYAGAARLLRDARSRWPGEPRIPLLLGDLYTDRELHSLALDEYLEAERLDPENLEVLQRAADAYGFLNREEDSIRYLQRILDKNPGNVRALGDLGWMLFKTHRLSEGVQLLEKAEREVKRDIGFSMTLGTLYAELYDYPESRLRYLETIEEARSKGYSRFASVAYYNLSLLEARFRLWDAAMEAADQSILMEARPSGYLARGELRLAGMDLRAAAEDFRSAYSLDTTPLARLSLAEAALAAGRPDEALDWAREVAKLEEHPWMASFGTDPDSFSLDIHELLGRAYEARAFLRGRRPKPGPWEALKAWALGFADRVKASYHGMLFRKFARSVSRAYRREGAELPAAAHAFLAFREYPRLARKYLRESRALETAHVPGSGASYDLEEARLAGDAAFLADALGRLDPAWERDLEAEGLSELAKLLNRGGRKREARGVLERLWLISPGILPCRGFAVPALVVLETAPELPRKYAARLERALRRLGMGFVGDADEAFGFVLRLRVNAEGAEFELLRASSETVLRSGSARFSGAVFSAAELAGFLFDNLHGTSL